MIRTVPGLAATRKNRRVLQLSIDLQQARAEIDRLQGELQRNAGSEKRLQELIRVNAVTQAALDKALAECEKSASPFRQWPNRNRELHFLQRQLQTKISVDRARRASPAGAFGTLVGRTKHRNSLRLVSDSGLFDRAWYQSRNPDVGNSELDPLTHFVRFGMAESRNPNALFDSAWYLRHYPQVAQSRLSPFMHYVQHGVAAGLNPNPLFDALWYAAKYPGVAVQNALADYLRNGLTRDPGPLFDTSWYLRWNSRLELFDVNPLAHYLEFWATEGGDPHPLFDTQWYLLHNPDVAQSGVPPLLHYVMWGFAEARNPNPVFDSEWYLKKNPDVFAAHINPLAHYLLHGVSEGRDPHPLFDGSWYLRNYKDVAQAGLNPLSHYLLHGAAERRNPHPLFDSHWYSERYPDAARTCTNLLLDYLEKARTGERDPNPFFDTKWYSNTYLDVDPATWSPLTHYITVGEAEGRNPSARFDTGWYRKQYPDIVRAGVSPLVHYLHHGWQEGRSPLPTPESMESQDLRIALLRSTLDSFRSSETQYSPLISILLPTYNTPLRYLQDAIQSVRRQTYSNWELCIVDDGSSDQRCIEYLRVLEKEDPKFRVAYSSRNGGIAEASQRALEMADGEFVAFLDHDDVLATNAISDVVGLLREDPSIDMVYTDHAMMHEDGRLLSPALKPGWSPEFFLSTNYIVHLKVIRRKVVQEVGGFRDSLDSAQDTALSCKVAGGGYHIRHLPKILYYWRMHALSVASRSSAKPAIEYSAIQTYNDFLALHSVPATLAWPDHFRKVKLGAYKLQFPNKTDRKVAVVLPAAYQSLDLSAFRSHYPKTDFGSLPPVHLIFREGNPDTTVPGVHIYVAPTQACFNNIIDRIDCDYLVFLSPSAKTVSSSWLTELIGYLSVSSQIGAVGGKILDLKLCVQSGGLLLLDQIFPISKGFSDDTDGYWFNNRIASNVEAVSPRLLATPKALYQRMGGIPYFEFGDAAGIPYCLKLRDAGYRVVYNPWSKVVDAEPEVFPLGYRTKLEASFGPSLKRDRYYHPFFSKKAPYQLESFSG